MNPKAKEFASETWFNIIDPLSKTCLAFVHRRAGCQWSGWLQRHCLTESTPTRAMCKSHGFVLFKYAQWTQQYNGKMMYRLSLCGLGGLSGCCSGRSLLWVVLHIPVSLSRSCSSCWRRVTVWIAPPHAPTSCEGLWLYDWSFGEVLFFDMCVTFSSSRLFSF